MAATDDGQSLSWARARHLNELLEENMPQPGQLLLFPVRDDEGEPQGHALAVVESVGPLDLEGAEIALTVISASDGYYWWWIGTQASPAKHHLCRGASESCIGGSLEHEVIHIDEFRVVERKQAEVLHARWVGRNPDLPRVLAPPAAPAAAGEPPGPAGEVVPVSGSGSEGEPAVADPGGDRDGLLERRLRDLRAPRGRCGGDAAVPRDGNDRQDALRRRLEDARARMPRAEEPPPRGKLEGMLHPGDRRPAEQKRKREASPDGAEPQEGKALLGILVRALRKVSKGSGGDDDLESDDGAGGSASLPSSWSGKRTALKRLAQATPGKITERECAYMLEHLDEDDVNFESNSGPKAVALKFLQRIFMKNKTISEVGEGRYREMRTIATSLDLLMSGKALEACDMLTSRLKSLRKEVKDGNILVSKWFELLPVDLDGSSLSARDEEFATSVAAGEAKTKALLGKIGGSG